MACDGGGRDGDHSKEMGSRYEEGVQSAEDIGNMNKCPKAEPG